MINFLASQVSYAFNEMTDYPFIKLSQVGKGSIFGYHYFDIYNSINKRETTKYKTYDQIIEAYSKLDTYYEENFKENEDFNEIAKGKNVIVLQLESIQDFVTNRSINGKEITPNLNKFLNENIQITNMINQSYSTTADSEYTVMTSLYPLENGQAFSMYYNTINNDLYKLYKNSGYNTYYMHGNIKEFWCRSYVYDRLNIDKASFIDEFKDMSETVGGYLSDELFYIQAAEKLNSYNTPFFASLVAASSHTPYLLEGLKDRENKVSIDVGEYKETQLGNYLEAVNYADYAFGVFIDLLKQNDLYDDTVILVFGDHTGLNMDNEEMEKFIKEIDEEYNDISKRINYVNVICGMKIPGIDNLKIELPVSKLDIKPSLLQISGIKDNFSLGRSMFSTKDYAVINIGDIVTEKYYYYTDTWYYIDSGEKVDTNFISEEDKNKLEKYVENMKLELDISRSIPINNLFK